ncbi:hypothetical protein UlMin_010746 [Ulmus minor]
MNDLFCQQLMGSFLEYKRQGRKIFVLDADLVDYVKGKKLQRGRPWSKCKAVYVPLNINGKHWVALVIDLVNCSLIVLDNDVRLTKLDDMGDHVRPFCVMIPLILRKANKFKHLGQQLTRPWSWRRPLDICAQSRRSGDCGIYMLKHIELHSMGLPLIENINDENVEYHRRRYAIEIFDGSMEP